MNAEKKSLKGFYRTKSINEEISGWSQDERKEYIDWHKKHDPSPGSLLKKKLNLVKLQYLLASSRNNASQNSAAAQSAPQDNNDTLSLKAYSETADIKQQISNWDPNRINSYIKKHESEIFKSYLLRKKLRLARERAGKKYDEELLRQEEEKERREEEALKRILKIEGNKSKLAAENIDSEKYKINGNVYKSGTLVNRTFYGNEKLDKGKIAKQLEDERRAALRKAASAESRKGTKHLKSRNANAEHKQFVKSYEVEDLQDMSVKSGVEQRLDDNWSNYRKEAARKRREDRITKWKELLQAETKSAETVICEEAKTASLEELLDMIEPVYDVEVKTYWSGCTECPYYEHRKKIVKKNGNEKNILSESIDARIIAIIAEKGLTEKNGELRKRALKFCTLPAKQLKPYAPEVAREHESGVYLWVMGYNVEKRLGTGAFGAVWKVGNKAVKVVLDKLEREKDATTTVEKIIANHKPNQYVKKEASSYLNAFVWKEEEIFEASLANGDLDQHMKVKFKQFPKTNKTIRSLLRKARQILKGLKIIHDAGYSHCDIKPANLLQENTTEEERVAKRSSGGKSHKHRITVTDFGLISKLSSGRFQGCTPAYSPPDKLPHAQQKLSTFDVYSTGVTLAELLFRNQSSGRKLVSELQAATIKSKSYVRKIRSYSQIKEMYRGTNEEELKKFLWIIKRMVAPKHQDRLSVDEALEEVVELYNAHYKMALKAKEDERKEPEEDAIQPEAERLEKMHLYSSTISITELRKSVNTLKVRVLGSAHCQTYNLNDESRRPKYYDITITQIQPSKTYQIYYFSDGTTFIGDLNISGQEMISSPNKIVDEGLKVAKEYENRCKKKLPIKFPKDITDLSDRITSFNSSDPKHLELLSGILDDYLKCARIFPTSFLGKKNLVKGISNLLKNNPNLGFTIFNEFGTRFNANKSWDNMNSLITDIQDFSLKMFEFWRRGGPKASKEDFLSDLFEVGKGLSVNTDYLKPIEMVDSITMTIEAINCKKDKPYTYDNSCGEEITLSTKDMESAIKFFTKWKETIAKMIRYYLVTVLKELRFILEPLVLWLGPEQKITGILKDDRSGSGCITWGELLELTKRIDLKSVASMMYECLGGRLSCNNPSFKGDTLTFRFLFTLADVCCEIKEITAFKHELPITKTLPGNQAAKSYKKNLTDYDAIIKSLTDDSMELPWIF